MEIKAATEQAVLLSLASIINMRLEALTWSAKCQELETKCMELKKKNDELEIKYPSHHVDVITPNKTSWCKLEDPEELAKYIAGSKHSTKSWKPIHQIGVVPVEDGSLRGITNGNELNDRDFKEVRMTLGEVIDKLNSIDDTKHITLQEITDKLYESEVLDKLYDEGGH